jgi:hypothetical protein
MRSGKELCKPRMVVALDHKRYINRDMTAIVPWKTMLPSTFIGTLKVRLVGELIRIERFHSSF